MSTILYEFPLTALPSGTIDIPSMPLPAGTTSITFAMARCTAAAPATWPDPTTTIQIDVYGSPDGSTWQHVGAATAAGGALTDPSTGIEIAETSLSFAFAAPPAFVKATAAIANGPLNTSGTVTAA